MWYEAPSSLRVTERLSAVKLNFSGSMFQLERASEDQRGGVLPSRWYIWVVNCKAAVILEWQETLV